MGLDSPPMRAEIPVPEPAGHSPLLLEASGAHPEEYARHSGHADIIREMVDGAVGDEMR
jgi:hypothetical protein